MHHQPTSGCPTGSSALPTGAHGAGNTVRALERLAEAPRSAPELAEALQLDVRSVRRLLKRLAAEGYVVQDGGHRRRYRPTLRLVALGGQVASRTAMLHVVRPALAELSRQCRAAAHLWVPTGSSAVCVAHEDTPGAPHDHDPMAHDVGSAVSFVLDARLRRCAAKAFVASDPARCVAAVLDRGTVVGALGLSGEVGVEDLATLALAARSLNAALESSTPA